MTRRGLARFTGATGAPGRLPAADRTATDHTPDGADVPLPPALGRLLSGRPRPRAGEACELCAAPVSDDHRHVVDLERRSLLCACRGCTLLFDGTGPTHTVRYRAVPDRYVRVDPFVLPTQAWAALQIPVGIAFVVANSRLDRAVAFYPSPGGATESELPLAAWGEIVAANPLLAQVEPDVEAVLVRTDPGEPWCVVVPVDRCYELVGALRLQWRGFDGGTEVRAHIAAFFEDVEARCARSGGPAPDCSPAHPPRSSAGPPDRVAGHGQPGRGDRRARLGGEQG